MVQWLRNRLPMQGTRVPSLVQEHPTCHEATKPVTTTTVARVPWSLRAATTEGHTPRARAPQQEKPALCNKRSPRAATKTQRSQKIKLKKKKKDEQLN